MWKKILVGVLFAALIGVLVWGGVNRTLARNDNSSDVHQGKEIQASVTDGSHGNPQGRTAGEFSSENVGSEQPGRGPHTDREENCENEQASVGVQGWRGKGRGGNGGNGAASQPLDESEVQALNAALDNEYLALATYLSVMDTFGEVEPFASIASDEQHHINALLNQFNKYAIPVPENTWLGNTPTYDSLSQACSAAADIEIANAALYQELSTKTENPALLRVFSNLANASLLHHAPEFEACE